MGNKNDEKKGTKGAGKVGIYLIATRADRHTSIMNCITTSSFSPMRSIL